MKKLKTIILCAAIMFTGSVFADSIDTRGLSDSQVAELKIQALKLQQRQNDPSSIPGIQQVSSATLQEAEKWTNFGKNLGSAMVSTAKELGVAVNDFSKTDIGKITTAIIVFKLVGSQAIHFIAGLILIFLLPGLIISARRYMSVEQVKYEYQDWKLFNILPYKKKVITEIRKIEGSDALWVFFWTTIFTLASIIGSLLVMFGG